VRKLLARVMLKRIHRQADKYDAALNPTPA